MKDQTYDFIQGFSEAIEKASEGLYCEFSLTVRKPDGTIVKLFVIISPERVLTTGLETADT